MPITHAAASPPQQSAAWLPSWRRTGRCNAEQRPRCRGGWPPRQPPLKQSQLSLSQWRRSRMTFATTGRTFSCKTDPVPAPGAHASTGFRSSTLSRDLRTDFALATASGRNRFQHTVCKFRYDAQRSDCGERSAILSALRLLSYQAAKSARLCQPNSPRF